MNIDTPVAKLVRNAPAALADKLQIVTAGDLLRHYPRRYAQRTELTDLGSLPVGEQVTVVGEVLRARSIPMRHRRGNRLEITIGDGRGTLQLSFFNKAGMHYRRLGVGQRALFAGKVTLFNHVRQLAHPEYEVLTDDADVGELASAWISVYPSTTGLTSWRIARAVQTVLGLVDIPPDPLPERLRRERRLVDLSTALRYIHRPADMAQVTRARTRLAWDEAITLQVVLARRRHEAALSPGVPRPAAPDGMLTAFDRRLPFTLTDGQRTIGEQIGTELAGERPMHRLLQGEVGAGKTVVALRAMCQVIDAGGQAALLAPTEVLAAQHARSLAELLGPLGRAGELDAADQATRVALLTGSLSAPARRAALAAAADGTAGIVVGTHALIQDAVAFADLGLVVVDEQHRFGVEQRDALRTKASAPPHLLVMTATPIPRTVAMTVFGDLETSALRELPRGRQPISTTVVPALEHPRWLVRAWERVREEVAAGHRAFVVCPRIGGDTASDDDATAGTDAEDELAERRAPLAVFDVVPALIDGPLAGLRTGVLHGRLPAEEKDAAMRDFAAGALDVLVATTVIEVGIDVPEATIMVVLDADRFGLSQLHQLRGRVGRGSRPAICLLVTEAPPGTPARERLDAVASTLDGFELAQVDLEQRREGDVLGVAQSGRRSQLRMLSLLRDGDVIAAARDEATRLVDADPDLAGYEAMRDAVAALENAARADYLQKT